VTGGTSGHAGDPVAAVNEDRDAMLAELRARRLMKD
jgi:hypothetical protein